MSFPGEPSTEKHFDDPYFGAGIVKICGFDIISYLFPLRWVSSEAI